MTEAESRILIVGCGEQGAEWAAKNKAPGQTIISLDQKYFNQMREPYMICDVLKLNIPDDSIDKIHADFIINGLNNGIRLSEIGNSPDILSTDAFPEIVRAWYLNEMHSSQSMTRDNILEINRLLKMAAFREMWRVLKINGTLEIIDFNRNIDWAKKNGYKIIEDRPLLLKPKLLEISNDDLERSASLKKLIGTGDVGKIEFPKLQALD